MQNPKECCICTLGNILARYQKYQQANIKSRPKLAECVGNSPGEVFQQLRHETGNCCRQVAMILPSFHLLSTLKAGRSRVAHFPQYHSRPNKKTSLVVWLAGCDRYLSTGKWRDHLPPFSLEFPGDVLQVVRSSSHRDRDIEKEQIGTKKGDPATT